MTATDTLAGKLAGITSSSQNSTYRPLDTTKQEIRLLRLRRKCFSSMGRVEGTIIYSSLLSPVPYETVSYCWGEASLRAAILVNGRLMDVPASAEAVLSAIRYDNKERLIWIDAVCINQDDKNERGSTGIHHGRHLPSVREEPCISWNR